MLETLRKIIRHAYAIMKQSKIYWIQLNITQIKMTPEAIPRKPNLDKTTSEAMNKLKNDQLERRIEQFKQAKKPK